MEYKRKTRLKYTEENCKPVYDKNGNIVMDRELFDLLCEEHNYLCELEDKIENGTLVELPCKDLGAFPCEMGSTVWLIYKRYWNVADKKGFWVLRESKVSTHNKKRFSDDFGKFVFLTREEAEKRLEELKK